MMQAEEAKEARHSLVWTNVCKELDYRISCVEQQLRTCIPEDLTFLQRDLKIREIEHRHLLD